jgi:hypothetical protein
MSTVLAVTVPDEDVVPMTATCSPLVTSAIVADPFLPSR